MNFIAELKRRNVLRAGALYLGAVWALAQGISQLGSSVGAPEWFTRWFLVAAGIGFPFAMLFSWFYEWTPHGIQRESEVEQNESVTRATGKKLDRWIIAVLAIAVVLLLTNQFVLHKDESPATATQAPANNKSIAVLPFENLSDDKSNAYFASGMQDEILTRLAGIHDLKVISRTSTEQYASRPPNLKIVAEQLGVATVLEGSVQKAEGKVRINLQLIDARSDSHLWAQNYDRDLKDVFAVQSDVAEKVADALKAQLLPAESALIANVPTNNLEAHDLFLQGQFLFNQLQTSTASDPVAAGKQAIDFYRRAVAADPSFALAYAGLSYLQSYLHWYGVDRSTAVVDGARDAAEHALSLQPALPEAHLAMGYFHYWCHRDYEAALKEFAIAHAGMPNNAEVVAAIGYVHRRQGVPSRGIPEMQQASVLDPRNSLLPREIANSYVAMRRYGEADVAYAHSLAIVPGDTEAQVQRATSMMFSGNLAAAERVLAIIPADMDPLASVSLLRFKLAMIQRQPDAALAVIAHAPDWLMTRWEHSVAPLDLLRGQALAMKGETGPARAAFLQAEQALQTEMDDPETAVDASSYLGLVYAGLGEKDAALKAANAAADKLPMSRDVIVGAFQLERLARVEAQVGETASAIDHLRQLMDSAGGETVSIATLRIDPVWDSLRKDPRFQKLIADTEAAQASINP
jgi:TolB-like protein/Tfp pilus assembly protein PilF